MKRTILILACAGTLALAGMGISFANSPVILAGAGRTVSSTGNPEGSEDTEESPASSSVYICGQILEKSTDSITVDNVSSLFATGEVIVTVDPETTALVDSVDGLPVTLDSFEEGDFVYAYIGEAMTLSLPPIVNANVLLTQPPQDSCAFAFGHVLRIRAADGENGQGEVDLDNGKTYLLPADCEIRPFRTRNIVSAEDISEGSALLIRADSQHLAKQAILFAD